MVFTFGMPLSHATETEGSHAVNGTVLVEVEVNVEGAAKVVLVFVDVLALVQVGIKIEIDVVVKLMRSWQGGHTRWSPLARHC
eukprot:3770683-Amphidinium_carterae.1